MYQDDEELRKRKEELQKNRIKEEKERKERSKKRAAIAAKKEHDALTALEKNERDQIQKQRDLAR